MNLDTAPKGPVKPFVGLTDPYSTALNVLASTVRKDRKGAWHKVLPLVPQHSRDIGDLVKALTALTQRASTPKRLKTPPSRGVCTICHRDLPHRTPDAQSRHGRFLGLYRARKNRWSKYPDPQDRSRQNDTARATILELRHQRQIEALKTWDPLRVNHLLATQGRAAALALWRTLPQSQRTRLLRAVPSAPPRLYKGEILVRKGLKPYRPLKGKDF